MSSLRTITFSVFFLGLSIIVLGQPTIQTDSVTQASTCAGASVTVPFTVTGGSFNAGNTFTAELSNGFGQFTNPVAIGTLQGTGSGTINANLPENATIGFLYRIRVVADDPAVTGMESPSIVTITTIPQLATVNADPNDTICLGDTATLSTGFAVSYQWNTGDTTNVILVTMPGPYYATITDIAGCQLHTDTLQLEVVLANKPVITSSGGQLSASVGATYQWYLDGNAVSGATAQNYTPSAAGSYTVVVTDANGCQDESEPYDWGASGINNFTTTDVSVYPNPVMNVALVQSDLVGSKSLYVLNALGELVVQDSFTGHRTTVDMGGLTKGFYVVKVVVDDVVQIGRICIQ